MWELLVAALFGNAVKTVVDVINGENAKNEAKRDAEKIRSDMDTLLGTETGKLTTEYQGQKSRLEDYTQTVLGSQRQGFALRGDFGGTDSAAAKVIATTENKAAEDQSYLAKGYQAGVDTLKQQTDLAKDQIDSNLNQYLSGVTAKQISSVTDLVSNALVGLGNMKLPAASGASLMDPGTPKTLLDNANWDAATGYPTLRLG